MHPISNGLRNFKNKKDIQKIQGMLDQFDDGSKKAINNIKQIESTQKSRKGRAKKGGTLKAKSRKRKKSRFENSIDKGVNKMQLYKTQ
jgi:hypothetical protein